MSKLPVAFLAILNFCAVSSKRRCFGACEMPIQGLRKFRCIHSNGAECKFLSYLQLPSLAYCLRKTTRIGLIELSAALT